MLNVVKNGNPQLFLCNQKMSNKLNVQEIKEIDKFIKFLTLKSTQVIVQSRLGEKIHTDPNASGNDWVRLVMNFSILIK